MVNKDVIISAAVLMHLKRETVTAQPDVTPRGRRVKLQLPLLLL